MGEFNAADFLGTGNVNGYRLCAWYREFDSSKFDRLFDAAIANGVPFAYLKDARVAGKRTPYVEFGKYDDDSNHADLRCEGDRMIFMALCEKHMHYLEALYLYEMM